MRRRIEDGAVGLCFGLAAGLVAALIRSQSPVSVAVTMLVTFGVILLLGRDR